MKGKVRVRHIFNCNTIEKNRLQIKKSKNKKRHSLNSNVKHYEFRLTGLSPLQILAYHKNRCTKLVIENARIFLIITDRNVKLYLI